MAKLQQSLLPSLVFENTLRIICAAINADMGDAIKGDETGPEKGLARGATNCYFTLFNTFHFTQQRSFRGDNGEHPSPFLPLSLSLSLVPSPSILFFQSVLTSRALLITPSFLLLFRNRITYFSNCGHIAFRLRRIQTTCKTLSRTSSRFD